MTYRGINALAETVNGLYKTELIRGPDPGARGAASTTSNSPPWAGCTGTTPSASTATSATPHRRSSKRPTLADKPTTHWLETNKPSLHKTQCDSLSGIETRFNARIIPCQRGFSADAHPHHPTTREQSGLMRSAGDSGHRLGDIMEMACRGGWPNLVSTGADERTSLRAVRGYLDEISRTDVSRVDGVARNPAGVRRLLVSLARNTASEASFATLAADTARESGDTGAVDRRTVASYVAALERLFVIENLPAWRPHNPTIADPVPAHFRRASKPHYWSQRIANSMVVLAGAVSSSTYMLSRCAVHRSGRSDTETVAEQASPLLSRT